MSDFEFFLSVLAIIGVVWTTTLFINMMIEEWWK